MFNVLRDILFYWFSCCVHFKFQVLIWMMTCRGTQVSQVVKRQGFFFSRRISVWLYTCADSEFSKVFAREGGGVRCLFSLKLLWEFDKFEFSRVERKRRVGFWTLPVLDPRMATVWLRGFSLFISTINFKYQYESFFVSYVYESLLGSIFKIKKRFIFYIF